MRTSKGRPGWNSSQRSIRSLDKVTNISKSHSHPPITQTTMFDIDKTVSSRDRTKVLSPLIRTRMTGGGGSSSRVKMLEGTTTTSRIWNHCLLAILMTCLLILPNHPVISQSLFGALCPSPKCQCGLDSRGRMEVACLEGGMNDIPTSKISPSTEVIRIVPPEGQSNKLAIGGFFRKFKKLEELHIVRSDIPNIGEHSFWGVQSLRVLNLSSNNISIIIESNFKGLVSLESLSLADNAIDSLVSSSFQHLPKLKALNLSKNRISKLVERLFFNLYMLESLDISDNWLRELHPDVFRDVWRLKELRCRGCGLKSINPLLYALLPDLKILDLGNNDFKYLNRDEFGTLIHLRELYLNGNQISAVTDDTFRSSRLDLLNLASNRIVRLDRRAFYNSSIGEINLSDNRFESLEKQTFLYIRENLTRLDLSRNPRLKLSPILSILGDNPQLRWLSLANNSYGELPLELFERQGKLQFLNLSGNRLADIFPHHFSHLLSLRILDLSGNNLKSLDAEILGQFDRLPLLKQLYLHGNSWACDRCYIPSLLRWVQSSSLFRQGCANPNGDYCLRCASPPALYDQALLALDESTLDWCTATEPALISADDPRGLFIGCALILVILIVAALAIIFHSRWHAAHYYTHEEDRPEIGTLTPPLPPDYDHLHENEIVAGFDNLYFSNKLSGGNSKQKVATIEEMTFDPHLTTFAQPPPELATFYQQNGGNNNAAVRPPPTASSPMLRNGANNHSATIHR